MTSRDVVLQEHVYELLKRDSYPRYIRSEMYKESLGMTKKKVYSRAFFVDVMFLFYVTSPSMFFKSHSRIVSASRWGKVWVEASCLGVSVSHQSLMFQAFSEFGYFGLVYERTFGNLANLTISTWMIFNEKCWLLGWRRW